MADAAGVKISAWPKLTQTARRLGISTGQVKKLAERGELVAAGDYYGHQRFDPAVVEQVRRRLESGGKNARAAAGTPRTAGDGPAHARAFRLFGEGRTPRDVVIECELPVATVAELRRQFAEMGRDLLISARELEELRDVLDWRDDATPAKLIRAISARLRSSFERGQAARPEDGSKHTTEEKSSAESQS